MPPEFDIHNPQRPFIVRAVLKSDDLIWPKKKPAVTFKLPTGGDEAST
jgi:hypothetical protein